MKVELKKGQTFRLVHGDFSRNKVKIAFDQKVSKQGNLYEKIYVTFVTGILKNLTYKIHWPSLEEINPPTCFCEAYDFPHRQGTKCKKEKI